MYIFKLKTWYQLIFGRFTPRISNKLFTERFLRIGESSLFYIFQWSIPCINIFACFRIFKRFNRIKTVGSGTRNLIVWLEGKQRWLLCHQSVRQLITKRFRGQRANIQTEMSWVLIKRPSNIPVRLRIALFNSSHVYFFRESKVNH